MKPVKNVIKLGLAGLSALAISTQLGFAAEKELVVAAPFGPKSDIPDPRARQNGWLSNRAGVSETLIGLGYDMTLQPRLAVGYENISPTEWKLSLRKDVTFHDGTPMTAQSVLKSFSKLDEEGHAAHNPRLSKLLNIKDIRAEDDYTLVFETNAPNSAFL